jgi:urocanate hydratase
MDTTIDERKVKAQRGLELRCRGWRQEGLLRLLENVLEVGERPEDLVVYAATAKAARNWACFDETVAALKDLADDETLVMQSGKPVARFRTSVHAPRVLMANTNLVGRWATDDIFYELEAQGLTMFAGYTAGDWQFIGQQGIVQTTYETLAAAARKHFDGTLNGKLLLTAGLGAMGGAQPLAAKFLGAAVIVVEVDERRADRRIAGGYLDEKTRDVGEAVARVTSALVAGEARSVGLIGNAADLFPQLLELGLEPDLVTDQTSAHDVRYGYVPSGHSADEAAALRDEDVARYETEVIASIARHVEAMVGFLDRGSVVFEYGNWIRAQAEKGGFARANDFDGFVKLFIRPAFSIGRGPWRWIALSGDEQDIRTIDEAILEEFADDRSVTQWIEIAMGGVPHQGLPARTSWFAYGQRLQFGLMVNRLIAAGRVSGPVAMTRDHLDTGSVTQPTRETEGMLDGSDAIADWPLLNALLNTAGGADLVAIHQGAGSGMGGSISAGVTVIVDGTDECRAKLESILRTDSGIGVIRHADSGEPLALQVVHDSDLVAPMIERESA